MFKYESPILPEDIDINVIKNKLQNELELSHKEVKYLFDSGYGSKCTSQNLSLRLKKYYLTIGDDEDYFYIITFTQNIRSGNFIFPSQVARKKRKNNV